MDSTYFGGLEAAETFVAHVMGVGFVNRITRLAAFL